MDIMTFSDVIGYKKSQYMTKNHYALFCLSTMFAKLHPAVLFFFLWVFELVDSFLSILPQPFLISVESYFSCVCAGHYELELNLITG